MWTYLVSTWFLANRDDKNKLDDQDLYDFLGLITAFIFAYAIERPGVNALRTPVYPELIHIVRHEPVTFPKHHFDRARITDLFRSYTFTNVRPITKSILAWWAFHDPEQVLIELDVPLEIEHIYARKRHEGNALVKSANLEALGNKALLEKRVNIRAADYRFTDKKKYYLGYTTASGRNRPGTAVYELVEMATTRNDFVESDIEQRTEAIIEGFMDCLDEFGLLK